MPFIHPVIFWTGLGAVSVPVLIHILNRRRFRIRDWAAMKFLLDSLRKNRRRLRIEELILLAIRCLLILLLAMALARFTGCSAMSILPAGRGSLTVVYLLDDSYSMGQKLGNSTLFSAATTDLAQQLEKLPGGYQAAVLLTSRLRAGQALFGLNFITEVKSLTDRLKSLEPSDRRARLADSLRGAREIFETAPGPKRLYMLGDFRRIDLVSRDDARAIAKQFKALRELDVEVLALDYGRPARNNLTVAGIELLDKFAAVDVPARLRVTVRNNGPTRAENVKLSLASRMKVDGRVVETELPVKEIASIDPGEPVSIECTLTPGATGPVLVVARLGPDELSGDNAAYLALDVRKTMKVLVVDGRPDLADPARSESFFFTLAVDPRSDGSWGVSPDVITYDGLGAVEFDDYDAVVLMNLAAFPPGFGGKDPYPQVKAMERYVRGGGGLAIFTGDRIDHKLYNDLLWARGKGLCPYRIQTRAGSVSRRDEYFKLDPKSLVTANVLRIFAGERSIGAEMIRFFAFTQVDEMARFAPVPGVKPPRVLARLADPDGSPLIVTRQFGRGTVLMFYSTASKRWNDWPIDPAGTYAVAMTDMLAYVARPQIPRTARVGEPIVYELPPSMRYAAGMLRTPGYPKVEEVSLLPRPEAEIGVLRYERSDTAGPYTLTVSTPGGRASEILFARNSDPAEGDLATGGRAGLAAAFGADEFLYRQMRSERAAGDLEARTRNEYWPWLIGALLVLLAAELLLAQRFGHYSDVRADGGRE